MTSRELLRHTLATVAYRGGKTLRGAPASFATFQASPGTRTPAHILAHMGDLMDWALSICDGKQAWHDSPPLPWEQEVERFFHALRALDDRLGAPNTLGSSEGELFQGPIADCLTHIGQLAMLRRMAGAPIRGENYFKAHMKVGQVGPEQAKAVREFD